MVSQRSVKPWLRHFWFESRAAHFNMPWYANWQSGRAKDSVIVYGFDSHSGYFKICPCGAMADALLSGSRCWRFESSHGYYIGMWCNLVARLIWDQEVVGSSPVIPTYVHMRPCRNWQTGSAQTRLAEGSSPSGCIDYQKKERLL